MLAQELKGLSQSCADLAEAITQKWGVRLNAAPRDEKFFGGWLERHASRSGEISYEFCIPIWLDDYRAFSEFGGWLRKDFGFIVTPQGWDANDLQHYQVLSDWLTNLAVYLAASDFKAKRDGSISRMKKILDAIA